MMNRARSTLKAFVVFLSILVPATAYADAPVRQGIRNLFGSVVRDAQGNRLGLASDPATPLYTAALGTPLLAPDGHQITWGEWLKPLLTRTAVASIKCIRLGTHVVIEATDLVPNALYSVWLFTQATSESPQATGAVPSLVGDNAFVTDEAGAGTFNAILPAAQLSVAGQIPACLLDNQSILLQLAYHSDNRLYGGVPGPLGVTLDHITFLFVAE